MARKRTATFSSNRKILIVSTPTLKGLSRIELAYNSSDQRTYHVPCPHCEAFQPILWANIRWPKGEPEKAARWCVECGGEIPEGQKGKLLANGRWVAG